MNNHLLSVWIVGVNGQEAPGGVEARPQPCCDNSAGKSPF